MDSAAKASKKLPKGHNKKSPKLPKIVLGAGLTAGVVFLFLFLRLLAVSDWNWRTTEYVVDAFNFNDSVAITLGTLFAMPELTGILLAVVTPISIMRLVWPSPEGGNSSTDGGSAGEEKSSGRQEVELSSVVLVVALLAATVTLVRTYPSTWWVPVVTIFLMGILIVVQLLWRQGIARRVVLSLMQNTGAIFIGGVLVLAALVDTPWMPQEEITTKTQTFPGYVLKVEPGFVKILTEEREVRIFSSSEILARNTIKD